MVAVDGQRDMQHTSDPDGRPQRGSGRERIRHGDVVGTAEEHTSPASYGNVPGGSLSGPGRRYQGDESWIIASLQSFLDEQGTMGGVGDAKVPTGAGMGVADSEHGGEGRQPPLHDAAMVFIPSSVPSVYRRRYVRVLRIVARMNAAQRASKALDTKWKSGKLRGYGQRPPRTTTESSRGQDLTIDGRVKPSGDMKGRRKGGLQGNSGSLTGRNGGSSGGGGGSGGVDAKRKWQSVTDTTLERRRRENITSADVVSSNTSRLGGLVSSTRSTNSFIRGEAMLEKVGVVQPKKEVKKKSDKVDLQGKLISPKGEGCGQRGPPMVRALRTECACLLTSILAQPVADALYRGIAAFYKYGKCHVSWSDTPSGKAVVFVCRDCCKNSTAVICHECRHNGDHRGHRVEIAQSPSGLCDCGNPDALDPKGYAGCHAGPPPEERFEKDLCAAIGASHVAAIQEHVADIIIGIIAAVEGDLHFPHLAIVTPFELVRMCFWEGVTHWRDMSPQLVECFMRDSEMMDALGHAGAVLASLFKAFCDYRTMERKEASRGGSEGSEYMGGDTHYSDVYRRLNAGLRRATTIGLSAPFSEQSGSESDDLWGARDFVPTHEDGAVVDEFMADVITFMQHDVCRCSVFEDDSLKAGCDSCAFRCALQYMDVGKRTCEWSPRASARRSFDRKSCTELATSVLVGLNHSLRSVAVVRLVTQVLASCSTLQFGMEEWGPMEVFLLEAYSRMRYATMGSASASERTGVPFSYPRYWADSMGQVGSPVPLRALVRVPETNTMDTDQLVPFLYGLSDEVAERVGEFGSDMASFIEAYSRAGFMYVSAIDVLCASGSSPLMLLGTVGMGTFSKVQAIAWGESVKDMQYYMFVDVKFKRLWSDAVARATSVFVRCAPYEEHMRSPTPDDTYIEQLLRNHWLNHTSQILTTDGPILRLMSEATAKLNGVPYDLDGCDGDSVSAGNSASVGAANDTTARNTTRAISGNGIGAVGNCRTRGDGAPLTSVTASGGSGANGASIGLGSGRSVGLDKGDDGNHAMQVVFKRLMNPMGHSEYLPRLKIRKDLQRFFRVARHARASYVSALSSTLSRWVRPFYPLEIMASILDYCYPLLGCCTLQPATLPCSASYRSFGPASAASKHDGEEDQLQEMQGGAGLPYHCLQDAVPVFRCQIHDLRFVFSSPAASFLFVAHPECWASFVRFMMLMDDSFFIYRVHHTDVMRTTDVAERMVALCSTAQRLSAQLARGLVLYGFCVTAMMANLFANDQSLTGGDGADVACNKTKRGGGAQGSFMGSFTPLLQSIRRGGASGPNRVGSAPKAPKRASAGNAARSKDEATTKRRVASGSARLAVRHQVAYWSAMEKALEMYTTHMAARMRAMKVPTCLSELAEDGQSYRSYLEESLSQVVVTGYGKLDHIVLTFPSVGGERKKGGHMSCITLRDLIFPACMETGLSPMHPFPCWGSTLVYPVSLSVSTFVLLTILQAYASTVAWRNLCTDMNVISACLCGSVSQANIMWRVFAPALKLGTSGGTHADPSVVLGHFLSLLARMRLLDAQQTNHVWKRNDDMGGVSVFSGSSAATVEWTVAAPFGVSAALSALVSRGGRCGRSDVFYFLLDVIGVSEFLRFGHLRRARAPLWAGVWKTSLFDEACCTAYNVDLFGEHRDEQVQEVEYRQTIGPLSHWLPGTHGVSRDSSLWQDCALLSAIAHDPGMVGHEEEDNRFNFCFSIPSPAAMTQFMYGTRDDKDRAQAMCAKRTGVWPRHTKPGQLYGNHYIGAGSEACVSSADAVLYRERRLHEFIQDGYDPAVRGQTDTIVRAGLTKTCVPTYESCQAWGTLSMQLLLVIQALGPSPALELQPVGSNLWYERHVALVCIGRLAQKPTPRSDLVESVSLTFTDPPCELSEVIDRALHRVGVPLAGEDSSSDVIGSGTIYDLSPWGWCCITPFWVSLHSTIVGLEEFCMSSRNCGMPVGGMVLPVPSDEGVLLSLSQAEGFFDCVEWTAAPTSRSPLRADVSVEQRRVSDHPLFAWYEPGKLSPFSLNALPLSRVALHIRNQMKSGPSRKYRGALTPGWMLCMNPTVVESLKLLCSSAMHTLIVHVMWAFLSRSRVLSPDSLRLVLTLLEMAVDIFPHASAAGWVSDQDLARPSYTPLDQVINRPPLVGGLSATFDWYSVPYASNLVRNMVSAITSKGWLTPLGLLCLIAGPGVNAEEEDTSTVSSAGATPERGERGLKGKRGKKKKRKKKGKKAANADADEVMHTDGGDMAGMTAAGAPVPPSAACDIHLVSKGGVVKGRKSKKGRKDKKERKGIETSLMDTRRVLDGADSMVAFGGETARRNSLKSYDSLFFNPAVLPGMFVDVLPRASHCLRLMARRVLTKLMCLAPVVHEQMRVFYRTPIPVPRVFCVSVKVEKRAPQFLLRMSGIGMRGMSPGSPSNKGRIRARQRHRARCMMERMHNYLSEKKGDNATEAGRGDGEGGGRDYLGDDADGSMLTRELAELRSGTGRGIGAQIDDISASASVSVGVADSAALSGFATESDDALSCVTASYGEGGLDGGTGASHSRGCTSGDVGSPSMESGLGHGTRLSSEYGRSADGSQHPPSDCTKPSGGVQGTIFTWEEGMRQPCVPVKEWGQGAVLGSFVDDDEKVISSEFGNGHLYCALCQTTESFAADNCLGELRKSRPELKASREEHSSLWSSDGWVDCVPSARASTPGAQEQHHGMFVLLCSIWSPSQNAEHAAIFRTWGKFDR